MVALVPIEKVRYNIAITWLIWSGVLVLLISTMTIAGTFDGVIAEVWSWFTPLAFPTITLMIGVLTANAFNKDDGQKGVKKNFYKLTRVLVHVYFIVIFLTICAIPLQDPTELDTQAVMKEFMSISNYWLAPIQGVVIGFVGALFSSGQEEENNDEP